MMSHLPEHVPDAEIQEMFRYADKDGDGRISYDEFLVSCSSITTFYYDTIEALRYASLR